MLDVVTISGSPSLGSKSAAVLNYIRLNLAQTGLQTAAIDVRDLNPEDLFLARTDGASISRAKALLEQAQTVVVATPIYKAAYSGILKALLDLLPQDALQGKSVLPIATGGSPAHLLAIDYSLKPVLSALGATHILAGIHILDSHIQTSGSAGNLSYTFSEDVQKRLDQALIELNKKLQPVLKNNLDLYQVVS
jgi:FMN reductase